MYCNSGSRSGKTLRLSNVTEVQLGKVTESLKRAKNAQEDRCFSIHFKSANFGERTLDLEAESTKVRDDWANAIKNLVSLTPKIQ